MLTSEERTGLLLKSIESLESAIGFLQASDPHDIRLGVAAEENFYRWNIRPLEIIIRGLKLEVGLLTAPTGDGRRRWVRPLEPIKETNGEHRVYRPSPDTTGSPPEAS